MSVSRIVEKMQGNIQVESEEGKGSRFTVDVALQCCTLSVQTQALEEHVTSNCTGSASTSADSHCAMEAGFFAAGSMSEAAAVTGVELKDHTIPHQLRTVQIHPPSVFQSAVSGSPDASRQRAVLNTPSAPSSSRDQFETDNSPSEARFTATSVQHSLVATTDAAMPTQTTSSRMAVTDHMLALPPSYLLTASAPPSPATLLNPHRLPTERSVSDDPAYAARRPQARVLVVEDSEVNQKLVVRLLSSMGFEADVANNGNVADMRCMVH